MVKFYESSFNYDYPFPAVSLAYFLRYLPPFATHVLSTDVIDRHFDPTSQQLSTTRLHLKKSKIPSPVLKLLPKGILGPGNDAGKSYVLEKSIVDVREGWMKTESMNLEWRGMLSVIEKQTYRRPASGMAASESNKDLVEAAKSEGTDVTTTITLLSRFGQAKMKRRIEAELSSPVSSSVPEEEAPAKKSFFSSWSSSPVQRSLELYGLRRAREALGNSKKGMNVVLERLRHGGLGHVLEGMQQDRQRVFGHDGPWKRAWRHGQDFEGND